MLFEVNAFHEAFGDCVALMTALNDDVSRAAVLPVLKQENFLESTAENLAQGIRNYKASHNAAAPRHALNSLQWQLPATLPAFGSAADGPGKLINEAHSFGQIFSGCFYDTIVNIFQADGGATDARLLTATKTAGRLLARAVATAPLRGRFFREIGRAMVKAAEQEGSVANRDAIRTAFNGHGVALGTSVMLAPVASIAGAPPVFRGAAVTLGDNTRRELRERVGAGDRNMYLSPLNIGGERVAEMRHSQDVPLDALDDRLKGVIAKTQVSTLVGQSGGHAAILGGLPEANATADEVETFVRSLLKLGAIEMPLANGGPLVTRARSAVAGVTRAIPPVHGSTHVIRTIRGQKTLVRVRYVCRCHG